MRSFNLLKQVIVSESHHQLYKQLTQRILSVYSDENSQLEVSSGADSLELGFLDDIQDDIHLKENKRLVQISLGKYFRVIQEEKPLPKTTQATTIERLRIPTIDFEDQKNDTSSLQLITVAKRKSVGNTQAL